MVGPTESDGLASCKVMIFFLIRSIRLRVPEMCGEVKKGSVSPDLNLLYVLYAHIVGGNLRSMCALGVP